MEVILKQDVKKLGYTNEVVKVRPGYARNFLIPNGYAILASDVNRKINAENLKQKAHKEERVIKDAEDFAKKIENITIKIGTKASSTGKIFGSVNSIQLAEAIKEQYNFEIDRKKIDISEQHIKQLGTYNATISFYKGIKASFTFEVVAE